MKNYSMPTYTFKNTETQEEFEDFMSISAKEEYLKLNPHIVQTINYAPSVSYKDFKKPDDGFRDILRGIKKNNPRSEIETF